MTKDKRFKDFVTFQEGRRYIRDIFVNKDKNVISYCSFLKSNDCKILLPCHPNVVYKNEWISWDDWFGFNNEFLPFDKARECARKLSKEFNIIGRSKWNDFCKSGNKPSDIPSTPYDVYKNKGWISISDWLGIKDKWYIKTLVNENFFKVWSNDMAYVLGFWWADGNLYYDKKDKIYIFSITQHKKDRYILENILRVMGCNTSIKNGRENCLYIKINNQEICRDIIKLGGCVKKSLVIKFPNVPKKYLHDFVRGYFDGDGTITSKKGKSYMCSFCSGSELMLSKLNNLLSKEIIKFGGNRWCKYKGKVYKYCPKLNGGWSKNICYYLTLSVNDTRRMKLFLYQDENCLKLKRKYEKFLLTGEIKKGGFKKRF